MFPMEMQAKTRGTSVHFYYVQPPKEASGWSFPEAVRAHCVTSDGQLVASALLIFMKDHRFLRLEDRGASLLSEHTDAFSGKSWQGEAHLHIYL